MTLSCCDGLYGLISDAEIGQIATTEPLESAADRLVDLANQHSSALFVTNPYHPSTSFQQAMNGLLALSPTCQDVLPNK